MRGIASECERRILLLGPPLAGATTLIATVAHALERNAHGFGERERFLCNAALKIDLLEGGRERRPLGDLARRYRIGHGGGGPTRAFEEWEFVLVPPSGFVRRFPPTRDGAGVRVVLIDAPAHGIVFSQANAAGAPERDEMAHQLFNADGLIVVWPIDRIDDFSSTEPAGGPSAASAFSAEWTGALGARAASPKAGTCPRLNSIVVAFSCFDRELASLGTDAAQAAVDPNYVRAAIADNLRRNLVFAQAVRSMSKWARRVDLMAVSSFGLVGGYGETNWDFGSGDALIEPSGGGRLGRTLNGARPSLPAEIGELWLPILAADPVIRCATGRRHHLMFAANDLLEACA